MRKTKLSIGILAATLAVPMVSTAQENVGELEEIVVTGSFIKRQDSFDSANPVDVMTELDIEKAGTPNIAEIVRNQTFQYGIDSVSNIIGATGAGGVSTNANIRGLGNSATLVLMNGRRIPNGTNIQNMYPQILLSRVETLTDGGAALYGTDAVAGVMNFIPRTDVEGFEIEAYYDTATGDGDYSQKNIGILTGLQGDAGSFTWALSMRDRDRLRFGDRPQYSSGGFSASSEANPGVFSVPTRDATGALTGASSSELDPGCGLNNQGSGDKRDTAAFTTGFRIPQFYFDLNILPSSLNSCYGEFGANFDYIAPETVLNTAFLYNLDLSDTVSFESEFVFTRQEAANRGSPVNPGGRSFLLSAVPGENPGNPYRAWSDVNDNGTLDAGELLFAQDANNDGIADRGTVDANGDGLMDVILAPGDPFNAANGVAFNEDVFISKWRPLYYPCANGSTCPSNVNPDHTVNGAGTFTTNTYRFVTQLNYEISDTWSGYTSYAYHRNQTVLPIATQSLSAIEAGLQGELITSAGKEWFNPFSTQFFGCTDLDCTGAQAAQGVNSQAVWDSVAFYEDTNRTETLQAIDSVLTGDITETSAGVIAAAVGLQLRSTKYKEDLGPHHNAGDAYIQGLAPDWEAQRKQYSIFGEIVVPLFDSDSLGLAELNAAVRTEVVDDDALADLDSTNYKLGLRWEIADWVSTRASWGTAFIAPSLTQLFGPKVNGLSQVSDPVTGTPASFKSRTLGGNPLLEAETADVYNIGWTMDFLDGDLTWSFDYKVFDFKDRIVRPLPSDVLNEDFENFKVALEDGLLGLPAGTTVGPNNDQLSAADRAIAVANWVPLSDPRIIRDQNNALFLVDVPTINATTMEWKGFDTRIAYGFDSAQLPFTDADFGRFSAVLSGTYADEYNYQAKPDAEIINGAGRRNDQTGFVPPVPRLRANLRLGWDYDIHSVTMTGNYAHHFLQDDSNVCGLSTFYLGLLGVNNGCQVGENIPAYKTWDLQYRVSLDELIGDGTTTLTLGMVNMFDEEGTADNSLGGLETFVFDPRGRQWSIRLRHAF